MTTYEKPKALRLRLDPALIQQVTKHHPHKNLTHIIEDLLRAEAARMSSTVCK